MLKQTIVIIGILAICHGAKNAKPTDLVFGDPFAIFEKQFSHSFAHHYLWPWSQLMKAAAALDDEESLEEPQIIRSPDKFEVNLNVKRFDPEELGVKVVNGYVFVEGKHKETSEHHNHFIANHFSQSFALPAGTKSEEVTATLNEKGILVVSAPKHPLPPPVPKRDVPIVVLLKEESTTIKQEDTTEKKEEPSSPSTILEDLDLDDATTQTTHEGKIRKKVLKTETVDPAAGLPLIEDNKEASLSTPKEESDANIVKTRKRPSVTNFTKANEVSKRDEENGLENAYY